MAAERHLHETKQFVGDERTLELDPTDGGLRRLTIFGLRAAREVKLQRAHGGCLGTRRRRRTWKPAKSHGELDSSVDPWISEWGNPAGVMARHLMLNT